MTKAKELVTVEKVLGPVSTETWYLYTAESNPEKFYTDGSAQYSVKFLLVATHERFEQALFSSLVFFNQKNSPYIYHTQRNGRPEYQFAHENQRGKDGVLLPYSLIVRSDQEHPGNEISYTYNIGDSF